jgi:hypothetical protein
MIDLIVFLSMVFIAPPLAVIAFTLIGDVVEIITQRVFPDNPYCDIDPRCHPAYRDGWIGDVKVSK